jgi:hypothetical protein
MRRIGWMTMGLAALALAGCQKKTQTPTEAAGQAQAQAAQAQAQAQTATAAPAAAAPAARPLRKAGLWRMTMSSQGIRQQSELCVDKAVDERLGLSGQRRAQAPAMRTG